jgi:hypothetical protein
VARDGPRVRAAAMGQQYTVTLFGLDLVGFFSAYNCSCFSNLVNDLHCLANFFSWSEAENSESEAAESSPNRPIVFFFLFHSQSHKKVFLKILGS